MEGTIVSSSTEAAEKPHPSHRVIAYDMARGIGIILVVIGHALPMDTYARAFVYSFHMPLFFIISGAVMKPEQLSGTFLQKVRAAIYAERKLIANYLFYSGFFIVYDVIVRYVYLHQIGKRDLVWDVYQTVTLYGINVLWFLITLASAKVITALVFDQTKSDVQRIVIAVAMYLIAAFFGNIISVRLPAEGVLKLVYYPVAALTEIATMTPFVILGHTARPYLPKILEHFKFLLPLLIIPNILWCFSFGAVDYHLLRSCFPPLSLLLALTGSLAIFGIGLLLYRVPVIRPILMWSSRHSLFIMVTHEYLLIVAFIVIPILNQFNISNHAIYLILQIALLMVVEVPLCQNFEPLANRFIERIK